MTVTPVPFYSRQQHSRIDDTKLIFPHFLFIFGPGAIFRTVSRGENKLRHRKRMVRWRIAHTAQFYNCVKGPVESCDCRSRNESCTAAFLFLLQPEDGHTLTSTKTFLQILQVLPASRAVAPARRPSCAQVETTKVGFRMQMQMNHKSLNQLLH